MIVDSMALSLFVGFAVSLFALDLLTAYLMYRLYSRVLTTEVGLLNIVKKDFDCRDACIANAKAIGELTIVVSGQRDELKLSRVIANANQAEILKAVHRQADDLYVRMERTFMPRGMAEAAHRDLYSRTEAFDSDQKTPPDEKG